MTLPSTVLTQRNSGSSSGLRPPATMGIWRQPGGADTAKAGQPVGNHGAAWTEVAVRPSGDRLGAGSRYFCESFYGHPCPTSGKNHATANACGCPSRPASFAGHPTRGAQHHSRNDSTRCRKACIFTTLRSVKTHALSLLGTTRLLSRSGGGAHGDPQSVRDRTYARACAAPTRRVHRQHAACAKWSGERNKSLPCATGLHSCNLSR